MGKEIDRAAKKAGGEVTDRAIWVLTPSWAIPPDLAAALPAGVTIREGKAYAKDVGGLVVAVHAGGRSDEPPVADWEAAARRTLADALAERVRLQNVYDRRLLADRDRLRAEAKARGIELPPKATDTPSTSSPTDTPAGDDTPEEN